MASLSYHEQKDIENIKRLRTLIKELPPFCSDFFRGIETTTSTRTRLAYAYDLRIFFEFLKQSNPEIAKQKTPLTLSVLEQLTVTDMEEYVDYIKCHPSLTSEDITNEERGIMRKISSLRSFYNYYYQNQRIEKNPAALLRMPKLHEKNIIRLEIDEVAKLLDLVDDGEKLTENRSCIISRPEFGISRSSLSFWETGIRVSECVGLNLDDIDLEACGARVYRKGGKEAIVYFSDEVRDTLEAYIQERKETEALPGHEEALFLSLQKKRLSVRSVENLVKKYSRLITPLKRSRPTSCAAPTEQTCIRKPEISISLPPSWDTAT